MKQLPRNLESKVVRVPFSTCWYWVGAMGSTGYGHVKVSGSKKTEGAHRAAFKAFGGTIPDGHDLDHLCRVRSCINPDHLEPVTRLENLCRAGIIEHINKLAKIRGAQSHCKAGHLLSGENLYIHPTSKSRVCIECRRVRDRKQRISP